MGSEGHPTTIVHVTGFKKFQGVAENPTETIVSNLKEFVKRGLPGGITLGSCTVLETAGIGALPMLYTTMESGISHSSSDSSCNEQVIWVSFNSATYSFFNVDRNHLYLWMWSFILKNLQCFAKKLNIDLCALETVWYSMQWEMRPNHWRSMQ